MPLSRLLSTLSLAGLVATGAAGNTATPPGDAASTVEAVAATGGRTLEFDGVVAGVRAAGVAAQGPAETVGPAEAEGDRVGAGARPVRDDAREASRHAA